MSSISAFGADRLAGVLERIGTLGGNAGNGPSFEALLEAANSNVTGPVLHLESTPASSTAATPTVGSTFATASAWPSLQAASSPQSPTNGDWAAQLPEAASQWIGAINEAAQRNDVDPRLLASLVWTESGFRADAVSGAGARGLTQLMPGTAAGMGINPDDPLQNLEGGARYLRAALDRFGSTDLALAAYNAGPGNVAKYGGVPPFAETQKYVSIVLDRYQEMGGRP
jgi:soluble lytic murein transglycosylase-like protein